MITHRQLLPCTAGLALAMGVKPDDVCANCRKVALRKTYPVKFPDQPYANGQYGFVCSVCWRKYRNRREELMMPTEVLVFDWYGRDMIAPPHEFFSRLPYTPFTASVVEYYNKNGFISLKQYEAAIQVTENHNGFKKKKGRKD